MKYNQKIKNILRRIDKPVAVILGAGINGLGVVRSLGDHNIPVLVLDSDQKQSALFSKYCISTICPDVKQSEEEFLNFLLEIGSLLTCKGIIFPTTDDHLLTVSRYRSKLKNYYEVPIAAPEVIEKLVNKQKFSELLQNIDIDCPTTYILEEDDYPEKIKGKLQYPCFLKPVYSSGFGDTFHCKGFVVNSEEELFDYYKKAISAKHKMIIQEIIPGPESNVQCFFGYFNQDSKPLGVFTHKRIRTWPSHFGNTSTCESIRDSKIIDLVISLLRKINYYGITEVEFKRDYRDNKFKILEVNARSAWPNKLATRCGVNLPYIAYLDAMGGKVEGDFQQLKGIKWIHVKNDVRSFLEGRSKGECTLEEWIHSIKGRKEYAFFDKKDPIPFIIETYKTVSAMLVRGFKISCARYLQRRDL